VRKIAYISKKLTQSGDGRQRGRDLIDTISNRPPMTRPKLRSKRVQVPPRPVPVGQRTRVESHDPPEFENDGLQSELTRSVGEVRLG